jgi:hypothetical protein
MFFREHTGGRTRTSLVNQTAALGRWARADPQITDAPPFAIASAHVTELRGWAWRRAESRSMRR